MGKKHIVITGQRGVGKTTLLERLLAHCTVPISGFVTRGTERDADGFHSVHMFPASAQSGEFCEVNRVGTSNRRVKTSFPQVFDTLGVALLSADPGSVIVMDELGFMEREAMDFRAAVMKCLDGDIPVIAVVRMKEDEPFLQEILAHPDVCVYTVTPENRDAIFDELLPVIQRLKN